LSATFWPKKAEHQKNKSVYYKESRKTTKGEEIGEREKNGNRVKEL
jgi:hypothetical protein